MEADTARLPGIAFRRLGEGDREQILAVTAEVWEGTDYIPGVLDEWLAPGAPALVGAWTGASLAALARLDLPVPGYAWLEGLRTHHAWRSRGIGRALAEHVLAVAVELGARRAGASVYTDNEPSQRLMRGLGFEPVAGFIYLTAEPSRGPMQAAPAHEVEPVPSPEAAEFIALRRGSGFLPNSWRFLRFDPGSAVAVGRMRQLAGIRRNGSLAALMAIGEPIHGPTEACIDFLDGDAEDIALLVRHARHLCRDLSLLECMLPGDSESASAALEALLASGFETWNQGRPDVLVLERDLPLATS
jgi:GNAT superfamily N-acetyltransferase